MKRIQFKAFYREFQQDIEENEKVLYLRVYQRRSGCMRKLFLEKTLEIVYLISL